MDDNFELLPSNGKEKYLDGVTHYPFSPDRKFLIATTSEYVRGKWLGYLLVYAFRDTWALHHRITPGEYVRPIQFIDDTRMLLLCETKLSLLDVASGKIHQILEAKSGIYSNAHVTSDGECVAAVAATEHGVEPSGIDMANLETLREGKLSFGKNRFLFNPPDWMGNRKIPIRVHNGMVELATEIA